MQAHRFYLDPARVAVDTEGANLRLSGEAASYLGRVLRLGAGDLVEAFDGLGGIREARVVAVEGRELLLELGPTMPGLPLPPPFELLQAVLKGEKMDWVIQKCCELGVTAIRPVATERCVVRLDPKKAERRLERWSKIAEEACRQCGRADLPVLHLPASLPQVLASPPQDPAPLRLVAWEEAETGAGLRAAVRAGDPRTGHALLVGPEGGLTPAEVEAARAEGFQAVSLGARILRAETAGAAVLSAVRFEQGELGD